MRFLKEYLSECWILALPLMLIICAVVWLHVFGLKNVAWLVGNVGPAIAMLIAILYAAVRDPKNRWPNASWLTRLANILTFRR